MSYYVYRIKFKDHMNLRQTDFISNSLDEIELEDKDKVIIIVSQSMVIMGAYEYNKEQNQFVREKEINKVVSLFYEKLPMIEFVNENTYRMFSKRLRKIDEENYKVFLENVTNIAHIKEGKILKNQNNYKKEEELLSNINQSVNDNTVHFR